MVRDSGQQRSSDIPVMAAQELAAKPPVGLNPFLLNVKSG